MAGFDPKTLNGKHQACPMCGGTDRFRWTNYRDGGEYFCSGCGAGDGFNLIADRLGVDFAGAAKEVDRLLGNDIPEVFQPKIDVERRRANLNALWKDANNNSIFIRYLEDRGFEEGAEFYNGLVDLRGHPNMYNADTGQRQPGMCALIRNYNGSPISIHRTFFDPKAKKIMPPTEKIAGACIWLGYKTGKQLVIGEGIETTLMGMAKYKCSGLAAISAHGMESLIVPACDRLIILADNDKSFTGQKAAFALAHRLRDRSSVEVVMPSERGYDFLDMEVHGYADTWVWSNIEL